MDPADQHPAAAPPHSDSVTIGNIQASHDVFVGSTITINNPAEPPPIPLTRQTWRPWLRAHATPRALLLILAALLLGSAALVILYPVVQSRFFPAPLIGDFKMAIAQFGAVDAQGRAVNSPDPGELAQIVYEAVDKEKATLGTALGAGGVDVGLALSGPATTGAVRGSTREQRAQAAAALAKRLGVDLVVYGTLQTGGSQNRFTPEFYLPEGKLRDDEQLLGPYDFGGAIALPVAWSSNPAVRIDVRAKVQARVHALAQFGLGLGNYVAGQYDAAQRYFQAAVDTPGWADQDGKEVLYLFLGKAAGRQGDLAAATVADQHALVLNPEYARARLDLADLQFSQARGDCQAGHLDIAGVRTAAAGFRQALQARDRPIDSDIAAKVDYGLGKTGVCLSQAEVEDDWASSGQDFRAVIAAYTAGDPRLRNLAAESYADLALVDSPAPDDPQAATKYRQAADDYTRAITTSERPDRRGIFSAGLAYIEGRLHQYDQADRAYATAISLDPTHADAYQQAQQALQQERGNTQK